MKLELEENEINFVLQALGQLPMSQVESLVYKIRIQVNPIEQEKVTDIKEGVKK